MFSFASYLWYGVQHATKAIGDEDFCDICMAFLQGHGDRRSVPHGGAVSSPRGPTPTPPIIAEPQCSPSGCDSYIYPAVANAAAAAAAL
ncbi:UNVERIFIED_CONTAM: hypothetical protein FKN15_074527 [Acipenser sinensis]